MASRVFMVEPSRVDIDVSSAKQYGELVTVFSPPPGRRERGEARAAQLYRPSLFDLEAYTRRFADMMESLNFDPDKDFFLATGAMMAVCLAFSTLAIRYGTFKVLVYNSSQGEYVVKVFDGSKLLKGDTHEPTAINHDAA